MAPHTEIIMVTGYATVSSAVDALKKGAAHYLSKPIKLDELRATVREIIEKKRHLQMQPGTHPVFRRAPGDRQDLHRPGHRRGPGAEVRAPVPGRAAG